MSLVGKDVYVESSVFLYQMCPAFFLYHVVAYRVLTLEVAKRCPLLVIAGVRVVVLQYILRMWMFLHVTAQLFVITVMHHKVHVVVPWNETLVAESTQDVATVYAARHTYRLCCLLQIDSHVQHPQLCLPQGGAIRIVFPPKFCFCLACVVCLFRFHNVCRIILSKPLPLPWHRCQG